MNIRFTGVLVLILSLLACAAPRQPEYGQAPAAISSGSEQVDQLIAQARSYRDLGEYDRALPILEQALRIESRNALLWYEMASLRLDQGINMAAEDSAQRAIRFSRDNTRVAIQSWLLIAEARKRQGNDTGAELAMEKARALSREVK
jgi:Tfp pilus assembly protein PilF